MPPIPSAHAIAAVVLTGLAFWLFAQGKLRIELICLLLIAILALGFYFFPLESQGGQTGVEIAFGGFGHEALVAICALMILGRGLVVTGALEPATRLLARIWRHDKGVGMLLTLLVCGGFSMFVNDTPVLVIALPILLDLASRGGAPASKTLMPANSAILIGGMTTTIGTSTNLLVVSIAQDLGLPRVDLFQFSDVALIAALVALPYLWLVMPRLLPTVSVETVESSHLFDAGLHCGEGCALIGHPFASVAEMIGHDIQVTGIMRGGADYWVVGAKGDSVQQGDIVLVSGSARQLSQASGELKATLATPEVEEAMRLAAKGRDIVNGEMVVGSQSQLIGQSVQSAQLADRYGVAVLGSYRASRSIFTLAHPVVDRLESGDVLLVRGANDRLQDLAGAEALLMLEGNAEIPRTHKAPLALAIAACVVGSAAFHLVPISIAALAGVIAMLATGCIRFDRIGRALSAEVIVLVAASIALGRAWVETGAAEWFGQVFAIGFADLPPPMVLAAVIGAAALLTNFVSNAAAAAVCTPIAMSLSRQLAIDPEPLVAAVLFGANLCFVTPMAYQTNLIIMTAAGYRFRDYVRAGLPLALLLIVTLSILLVAKYKL